MTICKHTEPGGKVVNEDYLFARRHPKDHRVIICALGDGQGGRAFGAEAAKAACEAVWVFASALPPSDLSQNDVWPKVIAAVDAAAVATGGFTTIVAVAVGHDRVAGASCGDSKAFFRANKQAEVAELTYGQPKNPPIGSEAAASQSFMCQPSGEGRLVLVSDGVWKYCGYESLKEAFELPLDAVVAQLRQATLRRCGPSLPDDFSLIAIDIG